jgi:hypothetical protein
VVGAAVGAVLGTVLVVYLLTKKKTITGCAVSSPNGMTITDEKDKAIYAIAGDPSSIPAGHRVKLQGKKIKPQTADRLVWETEKVAKDFGACQ